MTIARSVTLPLLICISCLQPVVAEVPATVSRFVTEKCTDCHSQDSPEGGFDITALADDLSEPRVYRKWVRIFDRVKSGEMPPPDHGTPPKQATRKFLQASADWITRHDAHVQKQLGRVRGRRLTKLQLERALHDVLGIDIPLASRLPDETTTGQFTTVADGQPMSHFQMAQHLELVDFALDEAFARVARQRDYSERTFSAKQLCRRNPRRRCREPELFRGKAVTWNGSVIFYGRLPATTAREDGWYRFTVRASALKSPDEHGVWVTVRSGFCVSSAPLLSWVTSFETQAEPREWTFDAWLPKGHMLEMRPGDATLKVARFAGGQIGTGEGDPQNVPGLAIHQLTMQRIHKNLSGSKISQRLFGDCTVRAEWNRAERRDELIVQADEISETAQSLIAAFASRAFRRPVRQHEVAPYVDLVQESLGEGVPFAEALRNGYRAILCSPRFLFFYEQPGPLDDYALASRLAFLIWNAPPDETLLKLASAQTLRDRNVLLQQLERLLNDPRGNGFVQNFAREWLELGRIDFTQPDRRRFRDYDLVIQQSMLDETHAFLKKLIDDNLSVTHLIDSDFTFLNSRLARHYEIPDVTNSELQQVSLPVDSRRGGVLTHGSILKITANGSSTSPVLRGAWVAERLLGDHIPPPPENVPAIEPDIRGATSIRDILEKHRSHSDCAGCHRLIDPPGFVLENFDPTGSWREHYTVNKGRRRGALIEPGYQLADGQKFSSLAEFQQLIIARPEKLARNFVSQLLTYGTGASISFADRAVVADIVNRAASEHYGLRSLIRESVASTIFLRK